MKKTVKILSTIVMIVMFILMSNISIIYAGTEEADRRDAAATGGVPAGSSQSGIINPDDFKPNDTDVPTEITDLAGTIIGTLQVIGIIIAVIVIMVIGIKYMTGSLEQKAQYKKTMIPYIVGVAMLVCTTTLVKVIYQLVSGAIA